MDTQHKTLSAKTPQHRLTMPSWYDHAPQVHSKDHVYLIERGLIYTSPCIVSQATSRCAASILLTVERTPFELSFRGNRRKFQAVTVRPLVERSLHTEDGRLVSVLVHPDHPQFSRFRTIGRPGYLVLNREDFAHLDAEFEAAANGTLPIDRAATLVDETIAAAVKDLPDTRRSDTRIDRVIDLLKERPDSTLAEMAVTVGLSCNRLSHLFADVVGLPWRSYVLWQKVRTAGLMLTSGRRLTEIALTAGFADSAHLSNTWQQAFGASPSQFLNSEFVELHYERDRLQAHRAAAGLSPSQDSKAHACPHCGRPFNEGVAEVSG